MVVVLVLVLVVVVVGGGGGGVILGEAKARPKDIISFSLDYISKSKVQTSNPSSSPISLDTPARPADSSSSYSLGAVLSEEMEAVGVLNCFAVLLIGLGGRMGMAAAPRAREM